jgi:sigma-54 dependent transcriptional regulator, acetoin dehydrogenase operon transcriptional activator AcoR
VRHAADATRPLTDSGALDSPEGGSPYLFLLLQRDRPLAGSARYCLQHIDAVLLGRGSARARTYPGARQLEIAIDDPWMSTAHARIVREGRGFVLEDLGSRNGTARNGLPEQRVTLVDGDIVEVGRSFFLFRASLDARVADVDEAELEHALPGMPTLSPALGRALDRVAQLAHSSISIVLFGESGTGKEVLARAIHERSSRPGPFIAVNCAALTDTLVASELFGHKRGAFSGAIEERAGLVRSTHGGTLLLDEVGDLTATGQGALLRVLQEGEVLPVGASVPVRVDTRVIAATHRDLDALVAAGTFRRDLLARLSGFVFQLPRLRERREDLGLLIRVLLHRLAAVPGNISFSLDATRALLAYPWPLNVRELEKCLAAAIAQAPDGVIRAVHLHDAVRVGPSPHKPDDASVSSEAALERRDVLVALLREHTGNVSAVAREMRVARAQIHRWLRRYDLDAASFRGPIRSH